MFAQLQPLVASCGRVTLDLIASADGAMKVIVKPSRTKDQSPALAQPLCLTASAAELDAGFLDAISSFTSAHKSLAEQVEATALVLKAAEKTQVEKATKPTLSTKPAKPAASLPVKPSTNTEDDDAGTDTDDSADGLGDDANGAETAATNAEAASGTDLSDLMM